MSIFRGAAPPAVERSILLCSILLLALAAWFALWLSSDSSYGFLHTHHLGHHGVSSSSVMLLFVLGWAVMTIAMMLPTTLPIIATFHKITGNRGDRLLLVALVILGYLLTWILFGALVYLVYLSLEWSVNYIPLLKDNMWIGVPSLVQ